MKPSRDDLGWLHAAARMARPYVGTTGGNPTVGALVVEPDSDRLLGRGVTARGGRPHAEPIALAMAGEGARGATLYATLEPCFHTGMTPPCADAVLAAGIARVVVSMADPDPRTAGRSLEKLSAGGVDIAVAEPGDMPGWLHEGFLSAQRRGRPFVSAKLAVSADGMIGRHGVSNAPVTGDAARRYTHALRARHEAILVGARTARVDDPRLDVRLDDLENRSPFRWVALGAEPADKSLRVFAGDGARAGVIATDPALADALPRAVERLIVPAGAEGGIGWPETLAELAGRRTNHLLVEGGAAILGSLLAAGLIDRFHLLQSPVEIGSDGVPASPAGAIRDTIAAAGLVETATGELADDRLTVFERER